MISRPLMAVLASALAVSFPAPAQEAVKGPLIVFIGPPGSGKSTQAAEASKRYGVPVISAEELIKNNPAVFAEIRARKISGMEPESDPVLNRLFEARLKQGGIAKGIILDGYPSTKDHSDFLVKMIGDGKLPNPVVIQLDIPDKTARKRLKGRPGESPERLEQRLKDYHREMDMVRLYFPNANITKVDGTKKPSAVSKAVRAVLDASFKK